MDDMVYSALRRKLAAAKAIGDLERIDRIRAMMSVSEEVSPETVPPARAQPVLSEFRWNDATDLDTDE